MTPIEAQNLQTRFINHGQLVIWTIYDHPLDFPNDFVLRPFVLGKPLDVHAVSHTLGALRAYIPAGLVKLAADLQDDPAIVETWL